MLRSRLEDATSAASETQLRAISLEEKLSSAQAAAAAAQAEQAALVRWGRMAGGPPFHLASPCPPLLMRVLGLGRFPASSLQVARLSSALGAMQAELDSLTASRDDALGRGQWADEAARKAEERASSAEAAVAAAAETELLLRTQVDALAAELDHQRLLAEEAAASLPPPPPVISPSVV